MIRLVCPECHEDSYADKVDVFLSCPYCGCIFSGKYGVERREKKRTERKIPFTFQYKGEELCARTINFSNKGLGIEILGTYPIIQGDVIELTVEDMMIKAAIMWVNMLPDKIQSGLKILN